MEHRNKENKFNIASLMEMEMSRHEFLRYVVAITFGVVGITSLIRTIKDVVPGHASRPLSRSYSRGPYGR